MIFKEIDDFCEATITGRFADLLHGVACIQGSGVWAANRNKSSENALYTCEDLLRYVDNLFERSEMEKKHIFDFWKGSEDLSFEVLKVRWIRTLIDYGFIPGTYADWLHEASILGTNVLASTRSRSFQNVLYIHEGLLRYIDNLFEGKRELAYRLMEDVRKGKGYRGRRRKGSERSEEIQKLLIELGAEQSFCERIKKIRYLRSEGACLPDTLIIYSLVRSMVDS